MAALIYSVIASLDGYVADADGGFDWAAPDEQVHTFVNDQERQIGTMLLGRRMYEVLRAWETVPTGADQPVVNRDFARIWRSTDKIVYSRTLDVPTTARTRVERDFDPVAVAEMKRSSGQNLSVGGPELAAVAIRAGLVDEYDLLLHPVIVGGGARALPDDVRVDLELVGERRFDGGVVHLHYLVR